ncbi:hypothetical protein MMC32_007819 [Xylographa parallela]|nr:hypothetical protein [Xylographa parallela]
MMKFSPPGPERKYCITSGRFSFGTHKLILKQLKLQWSHCLQTKAKKVPWTIVQPLLESIEELTEKRSTASQIARSGASLGAVTAPFSQLPLDLTSPGTYTPQGTEGRGSSAEDRAVVVKLMAAQAITRFRGQSQLWLRDRVRQAVKQSKNEDTKLAEVLAARQLKPGDLQVTANTLKDAQRFLQDTEWAS